MGFMDFCVMGPEGLGYTLKLMGLVRRLLVSLKSTKNSSGLLTLSICSP